MMTDINRNIAVMLKNLRLRHKLSIKKISSMLYIDDHTWSRYESGQSEPSVAELIAIYRALGDNLLQEVLPLLYPGMYSAEPGGERESIAHFVMDIASSSDISAACYILNGRHGSNPSAQLAMLAMIDHLPMDCRAAIASLIDSMYTMALHRGELVAMDQNTPDIELFRNALIRGIAAATSNKDSYTI